MCYSIIPRGAGWNLIYRDSTLKRRTSTAGPRTIIFFSNRVLPYAGYRRVSASQRSSGTRQRRRYLMRLVDRCVRGEKAVAHGLNSVRLYRISIFEGTTQRECVESSGKIQCRPFLSRNGSMTGSRPRKRLYNFMASSVPSFSRIFSRKAAAVCLSNSDVSLKAAKASASSTPDQ